MEIVNRSKENLLQIPNVYKEVKLEYRNASIKRPRHLLTFLYFKGRLLEGGV